MVVADGGEGLSKAKTSRYDFIFADTWPEGHQSRVDALIETLDSRADLSKVKLDWASGIYIAAKSTKS